MKRFLFFFIGIQLVFLPVSAQEWKNSLRFTEMGSETLDAPDGYRVLKAPLATAEVIEFFPGPKEITISRWIEVKEARYYLTEEESSKIWDGREPTWIEVLGTGRPDFIRGTTQAKLIKEETRDFFKTGLQTAQVYEEKVSLVPVTEWGETYRRAEFDFRLPVRAKAFQLNPDDSWEATFAVYPAFDSNPSRIPGKRPENWGEPYEVLITRPQGREIALRGPSQGAKWKSLLLLDTIWAATISEGRIQGLRLGYHELQSPYEVSRLSPPEFFGGDQLQFRFSVNRLIDGPAVLTVAPDRVTGVDLTMYEMMAELGGPKTDPDEAEWERELHKGWLITLSPDLTVRVVAPLLEGRGAAGMLELESLGLGPSFEEELKALEAMKSSQAPPLVPTEAPGWQSIFEKPLGEVPEGQRDPETQF